MKRTLRIMIMTGAGIVIILGYLFWILGEALFAITTDHRFNWWSIYAFLLTGAAILIGMVISVCIMSWKHAKQYNDRLKRMESAKNGGVNHENAEHRYRRKGRTSNPAEEDHQQAD